MTGDRIEVKKQNEFYEWRTYHIKVDEVKETENCVHYTSSEEYAKCMMSNGVLPLFKELGCLPEYIFRFMKSSGLHACAGLVNMSKETNTMWKNAMESVLNFRPLGLANTECPKACNRQLFSSTLATKRANREVSNSSSIELLDYFQKDIIYMK